jgi:peptidylprolyl isomerase
MKGWFAKNKKGMIAAVFIVFIAVMIVYSSMVRNSTPNTNTPNSNADRNMVILETSMGNITIELYNDMPITSGNFKNLVQRSVYDDTIFHRVVHGFVIQGGDATSKGITVSTIQDELPNKHSNVRGSVAMAKTGAPNSATSQFFINLNNTNAAQLDSNYSVFGTVVAGMEVVDKIGGVAIIPTDPQNPNDGKPEQNVTLIKAEFVT